MNISRDEWLKLEHTVSFWEDDDFFELSEFKGNMFTLIGQEMFKEGNEVLKANMKSFITDFINKSSESKSKKKIVLDFINKF